MRSTMDYFGSVTKQDDEIIITNLNPRLMEIWESINSRLSRRQPFMDNVYTLNIKGVLYIKSFLELLPKLPTLKYLKVNTLVGDNCNDFQNFVDAFASHTTWKKMTVPTNVEFVNQQNVFDCGTFDQFVKDDENNYDIDETVIRQLTKGAK